MAAFGDEFGQTGDVRSPRLNPMPATGAALCGIADDHAAPALVRARG